jgi:hypothetical protein
VLHIGLGFFERGNGKRLCRSTVTKTFDLGKDVPHPVTGLSSGSQLIKDCVIDVVLRVKKALQLIIISHGL